MEQLTPAALDQTPAPALAAQITPDLYSRFVSYIDVKPATVSTYTRNLRHFAQYLEAHGIAQPTRDTVRAYRDELSARLKPTTVYGYLAAVKVFFSWTADAGLYPDIARHVKGPAISKAHKKDYLTGDQLRRALDLIDRDTAQGKRDYALFALMTCGGLRDIEASRANIGDLANRGSCTVLYLQGKGRVDKADFVKVPPPVEAALREYLATRPDPGPGLPLFASMSHNSAGARLSTRSISGIIKGALVRAGYNSARITAHSLRHSAVTLALLGGNSLQEAQQFARHTDLATTQIYAHNLDREKNHCEETIAGDIFT